MPQHNNTDDNIITMVPLSEVKKNGFRSKLVLIATSLFAGALILWVGIAYSHGTSVFDLASCFSQREPDTGACLGNWTLRSLGLGITVVQTNTNAKATVSPDQGTVPKYPNFANLEVPDNVKADLLSGMQNMTNQQIIGLEVVNSIDELKTFYTEGFLRNGWMDASSAIADTDVKTFSQAGGFAYAYAFGKKQALVMAVPGTVAQRSHFPLNFTTDNVVLILTGESK